MRVLVACEYSGTVRDAFIALGHNAISCDLLPTEKAGPHFQGDARIMIHHFKWDLIIAHPPCTYLSNAGVRHLHSVPSKNGKVTKIHGQARFEAMRQAAAFFNFIKRADCPLIAIENPVPHGFARDLIGNYDQIIHPWQFGHGETKATCLWLKGLPKLQPTNIVEGRANKIHMMPGNKNQAKLRSKTYEGIAAAMAVQWSNLGRVS